MHMKQHPTGLPLKPEQTFFDDPALDRVMAMVMTVAAELHVTRDRLAVIEMMLESGKTITQKSLDEFQPDSAQKKTLDSARQQFVDALMVCTLGVEMSLGAPEEGVAKFDKS